MNAISLQSIIFSGASTFGPALAGVTVAAIGYAGNFFLNGASYLAVIVALVRLRHAAFVPTAREREKLWPSVRATLATARRDRALPGIIAGYGALLFLGPSPAVMLPIFALRVLHLSAAQMGFLFSAMGIGTILGGLTVASLGDFRYKGRLFLAAVLIWSTALGGFAASTAVWLSVAALLILGAAQNAAGATAVTLMQTRVPERMRGRIMSLNTLLVMGVRPLGDFPAGALIGAVGGPLTAGLSAALTGTMQFSWRSGGGDFGMRDLLWHCYAQQPCAPAGTHGESVCMRRNGPNLPRRKRPITEMASPPGRSATRRARARPKHKSPIE